MQDPTRIDTTLDALRAAWEGQPELSLSTLFGIAQNRGAGWNVDDATLVEILRGIATEHPRQLPLDDVRRVPAGQRWLIVTEEPTHRVTVDCSVAVVRSRHADGSLRHAMAWEYAALRPVRPGGLLVIGDAAGNEHRLGVVRYLTRLPSTGVPLEDLAGLERRTLGERVYFLRGADADGNVVTVLLDHGMHVTTRFNRDVSQVDYSWEKIHKFRRGTELVVQLPGGRSTTVCTVGEIYLAEAEPLSAGGA